MQQTSATHSCVCFAGCEQWHCVACHQNHVPCFPDVAPEDRFIVHTSSSDVSTSDYQDSEDRLIVYTSSSDECYSATKVDVGTQTCAFVEPEVSTVEPECTACGQRRPTVLCLECQNAMQLPGAGFLPSRNHGKGCNNAVFVPDAD